MKRKIRLSAIAICVIVAVSVSVVAGSTMAFEDVANTDWYYDSVQYVYEAGLMNGTGEDEFSPSVTITRGMIVTILWRREGMPTATKTSFADVAEKAYYADAVSWAAEKGIVNGYGGNRFGPQDTNTREQLATILYRYAEYKGTDVSQHSDLSIFSDHGKISAYAYDALSWANSIGLVNGVGENKLDPTGAATRAQAAAILERYDKFDSTVTEQESTAPNEEDKEKTSDTSTPPDDGESNTPPVIVPEEGDTQIPKTDKLTISIGEVEASPGTDVSVAVSIQNNPGILGAMLTLRYPETLQMISATNGQAFSELTLTTPKALRSPGNFLWDGLGATADQDGIILNFVFHVSDTVASGKMLPISAGYVTGDIYDSSFNALLPVIVNGSIYVK